MTTSKLIDKLRIYLALDRRKQKRKHDKLRVLQKKLKKRQRVLEGKLKKAPDAKACKRVKRDLKVLYAQRKKGVKLCRAIDGKKQPQTTDGLGTTLASGGNSTMPV